MTIEAPFNGAKYQSQNTGLQGPGSSGSDANFNLTTNSLLCQSVGLYIPKLKFCCFGEYFQNFLQLFYHPGFRFEKIRTQAEGSYRKINLDLAGNVILDENQQENNVKDRNFVLFGVGLSYKPQNQIELYGNVSQNYRSVTFNDIRTVSPTT
jgi:Fe(3+) dicitrate transport protein